MIYRGIFGLKFSATSFGKSRLGWNSFVLPFLARNNIIIVREKKYYTIGTKKKICQLCRLNNHEKGPIIVTTILTIL